MTLPECVDEIVKSIRDGEGIEAIQRSLEGVLSMALEVDGDVRYWGFRRENNTLEARMLAKTILENVRSYDVQ